MKDFREVKKQFEKQLSICTDNAKQEFVFLCEALLGINRADLFVKSEITKCDYNKLKRAIQKRVKGVPLQLIIGTSDFLGVTINESRHTLKPRQETMLMVEHIITT